MLGVRNVGTQSSDGERSIVSCALNHSNNQRLQSEMRHHGSSTHTLELKEEGELSSYAILFLNGI